jgi:hypothetical protein
MREIAFLRERKKMDGDKGVHSIVKNTEENGD